MKVRSESIQIIVTNSQCKLKDTVTGIVFVKFPYFCLFVFVFDNHRIPQERAKVRFVYEHFTSALDILECGFESYDSVYQLYIFVVVYYLHLVHA